MRRRWAASCGTALLAAVSAFAVAGAAAGEETAAWSPPPVVQRQFAELLRSGSCAVGTATDTAREILFRGRPAIEITVREPAAAGGGVVAFAFHDRPSGRIVDYVCFANASQRRSGEPILSLSEISTRADRLARAILAAQNLEMQSIQRYRESGRESIYYEARYALAQAEHPFLDPPVRLLLNATTGSLFRLDLDPDWHTPAPSPKSRITRQAAERVAAVVARDRDLARDFGAGAVLEGFSAAELHTVRPNGWLGLYAPEPDEHVRVAWTVPFRVAVGDAPITHLLFVDAASGRVLGGQEGVRDEAVPR